MSILIYYDNELIKKKKKKKKKKCKNKNITYLNFNF